MADRASTSMGLCLAWSDWGRRIAVLAGLGAALISLVENCPVWVASARGAGTTLVLALLVGAIARVLAWSSAGDREESLASARARNENKERR